MFVSRRMGLFLLCMFLAGGCYEDAVEITLHSDGSGTLKQKLVLSERFVIANEESSAARNMPVPDREEIIRKIGSALDITSVKQTNLPDGARVIELEGKFSKPEQFFLSDYCQEQIRLRIAPAGKNRAAIYCDMKRSGDGGPSLTQLYGLAKGLRVSRTVHLPAEPEKTNGKSVSSANTVSWALDLRNRDGLARTMAFIEGPDGGNGSVVFHTSGLKFTLPLNVAASQDQAAAAARDKSPGESAESMGLKAKVAWVAVRKKMSTDVAGTAEISDLEIGVELTWSEGHSPVRCEKPVLVSLLDDSDKDLVPDEARMRQSQIFSSEQRNRRKELTLGAKTPTSGANMLRQLDGYVEVITGVVKKTIVLENVQELAGKESTRNQTLDELNFKIESVKGTRLSIEIDGGSKTITSLAMIKDDGERIKRSGGMGGGNEYSYDFREDISEATRCELEVITEESMVKVPFSLEQISLP